MLQAVLGVNVWAEASARTRPPSPISSPKQVIEHLELSGFEIDEAQQVMTKRPPSHHHG
jgi:hypothetical protein